ncbi:MAG: prolyl oligopeptidase family serine peptidase [Phycisphaeraceae bacterium]|nr:prolyl oligopeptidase family serine peptidase [Phycisphaeraceae bacterium]
MKHGIVSWACACLCVFGGELARAGAGQQDTIELREATVLRRRGLGGRDPVHRDDVLAGFIRDGFVRAADGQEFVRADGEVNRWSTLLAGEDGWLTGRELAGGYACFEVMLDEPAVMVLEAQSHSMSWVNGLPVAGDPYSLGILHAPVALRAGKNSLVFQCGRGRLLARLTEPAAPVAFADFDRTLPDLVAGREVDAWMGVVVVNCGDEPLVDARVECSVGERIVSSDIGRIESRALRKVAVRVMGPAVERVGGVEARLELIDDGTVVASDTVALRAVEPGSRRRETFVSEIDGSAQYYSVVPASGPEPGGLILSLHGASVEASGQAAAYAPKDWATIVCPTNRRPFGFDWEDWGRKDAMEVLALASERLGTDLGATWLTGHSMGGHGTWHLGVTFPDRWAAIAPSAGWVSFWSYTGAAKAEGESILDGILRSATLPSDTLGLSANLESLGVYVLHGDADDNVPVDQARRMRSRLGEFHPDFAYYERPGAGHWWGNQCVDWPALMEFLHARDRGNPARRERIDFVTARPGVSPDVWWARIDRLQDPTRVAEIHLRSTSGSTVIEGTTGNVSRLGIRLAPRSGEGGARASDHLAFKAVDDGGELAITLDGQRIEGIAGVTGPTTLWIERDGGSWSLAGEPDPREKRAERMGPFKEAFDRDVVLVYGTGGDDEDRELARARALLDAQTFWYRGNGGIEVVPDTAFDPDVEQDRNVVLYGSAETNGDWEAMLGSSPVVVGAGRARIGDREFEGDDLVCLMVRPRPGSDMAMVGTVAWTGSAGARFSTSLPYFVSGVGYPDFFVIGSDALIRGNEAIRGAGYFGADWELEPRLTFVGAP